MHLVGILVCRPGIEPGPRQWECWVLTTGPPGNSLNYTSILKHWGNFFKKEREQIWERTKSCGWGRKVFFLSEFCHFVLSRLPFLTGKWTWQCSLLMVVERESLLNEWESWVASLGSEAELQRKNQTLLGAPWAAVGERAKQPPDAEGLTSPHPWGDVGKPGLILDFHFDLHKGA